MKRFTNAGRTALEQRNSYAALSLALTIPDICGSLEDPGPNKSRKRYVAWYNKWAISEFTTDSEVRLSADDCYQLRCSLIHSGNAIFEKKKIDVIEKIEFFDDSADAHLSSVVDMEFNGIMQPNVLILNVSKFCHSMFASADRWDESTAYNKNVFREKSNLLLIRKSRDMISGVRFMGPDDLWEED